VTHRNSLSLEGAGDEASIAPSAGIATPPAPPTPGLCGAADARKSGSTLGGRGSNAADDEDDDTRQLHELLLLARLPYCRATRTFTGRSCVPLPPGVRWSSPLGAYDSTTSRRSVQLAPPRPLRVERTDTMPLLVDVRDDRKSPHSLVHKIGGEERRPHEKLCLSTRGSIVASPGRSLAVATGATHSHSVRRLVMYVRCMQSVVNILNAQAGRYGTVWHGAARFGVA
jgi:hypothetical protein